MTAGPGRTGSVLLLLAAVGLLAGATAADPAGRLLLVAAALWLAVLAGRDLLLAPVLDADLEGLRVVDGWRRVEVTWSGVEDIRLVTDRRAPLVELDLGDRLVVLSRRRLARLPSEVVDELTALWTVGRV